MSYRQNFHDSLEVRGRVSRTVGPSQHSQIVEIDYHDVVPLDITIDVITEPFDHSVDNCNDSIDVLTGAVTGMKAAQCVAIGKTAAEVSETIINGFYGTIKTEISQQMQALDSAVKAGLGLIMEQGKAVGNQKSVMEADYGRIGSRYISLFKELDEECKKRIYALDKPAFMLSEKVQQKLIHETGTDESARNMLVTTEEASSKLMILVSRLAGKTRDIIATLSSYISQEKNYTSQLNSLLDNESIGEKTALLLPLIHAESDALEGAGEDIAQYASEKAGAKDREDMFAKLRSFCMGESSAAWEPMPDDERELVGKEFTIIAESSFGEESTESKRIYNTLMELWTKSGVSTLKRRA